MISRQTDYALRILRALTQRTRLTAGEIARMEGVPQQFAYKIIKKLEKAGFLQILRGAEGGCVLTAELSQVSLYDLMEAIGENFMVSACMEAGYPCSRPDGGRCGVHSRLSVIQRRLDRELRACTLQFLLFGDDMTRSSKGSVCTEKEK